MAHKKKKQKKNTFALLHNIAHNILMAYYFIQTNKQTSKQAKLHIYSINESHFYLEVVVDYWDLAHFYTKKPLIKNSYYHYCECHDNWMKYRGEKKKNKISKLQTKYTYK